MNTCKQKIGVRILCGLLAGLFLLGSLAACAKRTKKADNATNKDLSLNSPSVTIAVEAASAMLESVHKVYPNAKKVNTLSALESITMLTGNKVDAVALDYSQFFGVLDEVKGSIRLHSDGVIGDVKYCAVGVSRSASIPNAKEEIDNFMEYALGEGIIDEMLKRWIEDRNFTMPDIPKAEKPKYKIIFGTTGLCAPFTFYRDNELVGFDIELLKRFALWLGADYEIRTYDWTGIFTACVAGDVDYVLSNLFVTDERAEVIDFSIPYKTLETVMVVKDTEAQDQLGIWDTIVENFNKTFIRESRWKMIVKGLGITVAIAFFAAIFGTALGFGYGMLLRSKNKFISKLTNGFSMLIRGIPGLVVLMLIYFVIFAKVDINPVVVGIMAFSIMFMISVAGLLNTGIGAVDKGQSEAAAALGFTKTGSFLKVVLPQAIRHVLPLYKAELGSMIKQTAVVGYISIEDLTKASDIIRSRTFEPFFPLVSTAIIYFLLSSLVAWLIGRIEIKTDIQHKNRHLPKGVKEIQNIKPLKTVQKDLSQGEIIKIEHVEKAFSTSTPLKDINTVVNRGDVISIIGPSGTGKSTLLRCINALGPATKGSITIFGENICDMNAKLPAIRQRVGMVFQSFNLFNHLNVIENIMLAPTLLKNEAPQEAYEHAMQLLQSVGMADRALRYPEELSGGQKQRVAIARTLAMRPEIVLLDEPTSALDPAMAGEVLSVVRRLANEGQTMMIVTHEMQFARDVSTRIFYMDEGVIYEEGSPAEIFGNPKREKTAAFVQKHKVLHFEIANSNYDFIDMNERLRFFGEKHYLPASTIDAMQRAFEELCAQNIVPAKDEKLPLAVNVEYSQADAMVSMRFSWEGKSYNPLEEGDELSLAIVKHFTHSIEYCYENETNTLAVLIK